VIAGGEPPGGAAFLTSLSSLFRVLWYTSFLWWLMKMSTQSMAVGRLTPARRLGQKTTSPVVASSSTRPSLLPNQVLELIEEDKDDTELHPMNGVSADWNTAARPQLDQKSMLEVKLVEGPPSGTHRDFKATTG
jgi:hypothetical protein